MSRVLSTLLLPLFLGFSSSSHSADASAPIDEQLAIAYKKNAGVGVVAGFAAGLASAHWLFSPCKKDSMWERLPGYRWYQTKKRNSSHIRVWQIAENVAKGMIVVAITTGTAWGVYHTLNAPVQALHQLKEENRVINERLAKKDQKIQDLLYSQGIISGLSNQMTDVVKEINDLKLSNNLSNNFHTEVNTLLSPLTEKVTHISKTVAGLEDKIKDLESDIEKDLRKFSTNRYVLNIGLEAQNVKIEGINSSITYLCERYSEDQKMMDFLQKRTAELNERLKKIEGPTFNNSSTAKNTEDTSVLSNSDITSPNQ